MTFERRVLSVAESILEPVIRTVLDLLLPLTCAGCSARGTPWCADCHRDLVPEPVRRPAVRPPMRALAPYAGTARRAVLAYKERGRRALAEPLGSALAAGVRDLGVCDLGVCGLGADEPVWLVPAPSRAAESRRRGGPHLLAPARWCARSLGAAAAVAPVLRLDRGVRDSVGLDARGRRANLAGRVHLTGARPPPGSSVVLLDDVVTTGATAAVSVDVLAAGGYRVRGVVVLAATGLERTRRPSRAPGSAPAGLVPPIE